MSDGSMTYDCCSGVDDGRCCAKGLCAIHIDAVHINLPETLQRDSDESEVTGKEVVVDPAKEEFRSLRCELEGKHRVGSRSCGDQRLENRRRIVFRDRLEGHTHQAIRKTALRGESLRDIGSRSESLLLSLKHYIIRLLLPIDYWKSQWYARQDLRDRQYR